MPFKNLLSQADLERRLLKWISKVHVPRYPFFDGLPSYPGPSDAMWADSSPTSFTLNSSAAVSGVAPGVLTSSSSSIGSSASVQDLNHWLEFVEDASRECEIQESQYPDAAVWFMRGELREVMRERRAVYLHEAHRIADSTRKAKIRDWEDFKKDLKRVVDEARRIFMSTASQIRATPTALAVPNTTHALVPQSTFALLRRTHPYIASSLSLGLVIGGTVVLLPAIALGIEAWNRMKEGANKAGGQIVCPA